MSEEMTYSKSGVNTRQEDLVIRGVNKWIRKTFRFREGKLGQVMNDVGFYANVIDMGEFAMAICMDGVGSKVLVAQELHKFDTIGIDLVAMNVNDIICIGAEPIAMVDYMAFKSLDPEIARDISIGIYEGAKMAGVSVIGGETATLPEIISGMGNKGFDLAGTVVGVVKKNEIITGMEISPGDVVLGLESSGIHSNGLTLARRVLPRTMWANLLIPTRIYVTEILELIHKFDIHGLAHITGSGFLNLERITKFGFYLDGIPEGDMVFRRIQERGRVSDEEMYRTFNMGIGFCVVVGEDTAEKILRDYARRFRIQRVGTVIAGHGVRISKDGGEIVL